MNFSLTNFGRVRVADIELNGVTVITGPNGCGKSTISRVLFTWQTYLHQVDHEILTERAASIVDDVNEVLSAYDVMRIMVRPPEKKSAIEKLLSASFWQNQDAVVKWIVASAHRHLFSRTSEPDDLEQGIQSIYPAIRDAALSRLRAPDERLAEFLLERHLRRAFDRQVGTLYDTNVVSRVVVTDDAGGEHAFEFFSNGVRGLLGVGGNHVTPTFYLEPRHLIDEFSNLSRINRPLWAMKNRYSVLEHLGWGRILNTNPQPFDVSFSRAERQKEINDALDRIVQLIHGEIGKVEDALVFRDHDLPGETTVSLSNIASGVKTMAVIVRGMRNGTISPGSLIIIDEPETNLHPEWQVAFAKFLILLNAQFGVRLLLNTHSPYFLKAIQVNADLYERSEVCSYYNMVSRDGGPCYETDLVNDRIEEVFRAMSDPYARLVYGEGHGRSIPG